MTVQASERQSALWAAAFMEATPGVVCSVMEREVLAELGYQHIRGACEERRQRNSLPRTSDVRNVTYFVSL